MPKANKLPANLGRAESVALVHDAWDTLVQIASSDNVKPANTRTAVELGVRAYAAERRARAQERREALRAKQIRQAPDDQYIDARSQPEPEAQIVAEIDEVSARILRKAREVTEKLDDPRRAKHRGTPDRRAWVEELLDFVTEADE